ncbi:MAG: hypothetical protein AAF518_21710 [Spirochaetota bacterium]
MELEHTDDFDLKGLLDRLTVCIDRLAKPGTYSPKRRIRYRKLAHAIIKRIRWELEE